MHFMLESRYPIETAEQVKTASAFGRDHIARFAPVDRVVMASNLLKQASALGIDVSEPWALNYGRFLTAESYSPDFHSAMMLRKEACVGKFIAAGESVMDARDVVDVIEKIASVTAPQDMMTLIDSFDKEAGLDGLYDTAIPDPFFTVVGCHDNPSYDHEKHAGLTSADIRAKLTGESLEKIASVITDVDSFKRNPVSYLNSNSLVAPIIMAKI